MTTAPTMAVRGMTTAPTMTDAVRRRPWIGLLAAFLVAGCSSSQPSPSADGPSAEASIPEASSPAPSGGGGTAAMIPQPDTGDLDVADESDRVDLAVPTFSDPTNITNPLFELGTSNLLVGTVDDAAFRTEVTVLPYTRFMEWQGMLVETVVSEYAAFLDGQIAEIAYDLYAQADDGSVWYFGEDVYNFADGTIADTHGTWHAGIDGPAAMIMPADPQEGDVYRPENIPGLVFEEVVVLRTDETVDGPFGPVEGAIVVEEHHADGETEEKTFAPDYGEFYTAADGEVEALAMSVPTDAGSGDMPEALQSLSTDALAAVDAALNDDIETATDLAADLDASREELGDAEIPALLRPLIEDAIATLGDASDADEAASAAILVARLAGDIGLRYRPVPEVDFERIGLWGGQLVLDARANDLDAVHGTNHALAFTRERVLGDIDSGARLELDSALEELDGAIADEDFEAIAEIGQTLRDVAGTTP